MTLEEAGKLLILMHHFVPNYKPPTEAASSWQEVLGDMSYQDARRYVIEHFRSSRYVPLPVEILNRARQDFNPEEIVPLDPPDDMGVAQ